MNARSPIALVAAASGWIAVAGNLALWRELHALGLLQGKGGALLAFGLAGVIAACLVAVFSLLAWRRTLKPAIVLLMIAAAVATHFMLRYHVVIDSGMLVNALQTDRHESAALLDWSIVPTFVLGVALPAWVVWRWPVQQGTWRAQVLRNTGTAVLALVVAAGLVALSFQPLASAMRNHKQLRYMMNPLNVLYAGAQVAAQPLAHGRQPIEPLGLDATVAASGKPAMLVLVLGETARSGNFGINGYARPTTPQLDRLAAGGGLASFRSAWSCGTSTAASLPCMFSALGREGFSGRDRDHENLLDVLQHAGLAVLWLDNQSGCKGVCDRVPHENLCVDDDCTDTALLQGLDARIAAMPAARRARGVVVVMHQMGSHGPAYWKRSPPQAKRFQPECRSINLQDCTHEQLVNAYDNSIVATDAMLASAVGWLQRQAGYDTAMLYLSDHGESLGEGSLYLHGLPWAIAPDVQKHVPWITWLSPAFESRMGVTAQCLRSRADAPVSHDNLFHSVLGLMQVSTSAYHRGLDVYAGCGAH